MLVEAIEDTRKFENHQEKVRVYGSNFLGRMQKEHPELDLIGRMAPGLYSDSRGNYYESTSYFVGEQVELPRAGLGRVLGRTKQRLRILVELNRHYQDGGSVIIRDVRLRDSTQRALKELDEASGENYSANVKYSSEPDLIKIKQARMPRCEAPFL